MVHVIATIQLSVGVRSRFLEEFARIVPLVLAEDGCNEYGPTVDVPTNLPAQPPLREDVVVVVEKWRDLPALEAHLAADASVAVPTVGDMGELPESLPSLFVPNVPFNLETLQIIFPFALAMAFVGLLEFLMTAKLLDDITDTRSHKTREAGGGRAWRTSSPDSPAAWAAAR